MITDTAITAIFPSQCRNQPGPLLAWMNTLDQETDRSGRVIATLYGGELRWDDPQGGCVKWHRVPRETFGVVYFRIKATENKEYLGMADFRHQVVCKLNGDPEHPYYIPQRYGIHAAEAYYNLGHIFVTVSYRTPDGLIEIVRHDLRINESEKMVGLRSLRLWHGHDPRSLPLYLLHFRKAMAAAIGKYTGDVPNFAYPERIEDETIWYDDPKHIEQVFRHWEENQRREEADHQPDPADRWDPAAASSFERI